MPIITCEIQYTKEGKVFNKDDEESIFKKINEYAPDDILILSHGWNNDMEEARKLYEGLLSLIEKRKSNGQYSIAKRKILVILVLWPSKKFAVEHLIAGGGADITDRDTELLLESIDNISDLFDNENKNEDFNKLKKLALDLDSQSSASDFASIVLDQLNADMRQNFSYIPEELFNLNGREVMERLEKNKPLVSSEGTGGAAGLGFGRRFDAKAALRSLIPSPVSAGRDLLNLFTYYKMKERAGTIGQNGGAGLLNRISTEYPDTNIHLVGHSFGGRLVSSMCAGAMDGVKVNSLILIQAAFSHYGFSKSYEEGKDGHFRGVIEKKTVNGPILITHTRNDKPVGLAYPIASRLKKQVGSRIGDENDRYGGIGSNGAMKTKEAVFIKMNGINEKYDFIEHKIYNLLGDEYIGGHSDIVIPEVTHAILSAIDHAMN